MNQPNPSIEPHSLNATMRKFGAPQTIIRQYQYWSVMLRPAQATLGALVLAAHEPVLRHSQSSVRRASLNSIQSLDTWNLRWQKRFSMTKLTI